MQDAGRCPWCGTDPLYVGYHDTEWGVPETASNSLFEKLVLDGFQAGLAWITILRKRPAFRARFAGFDAEILARWGEPEIAAALGDAGIVRHRGKIEATVKGARAFLEVEEKQGFAAFLWDHVEGRPIQNAWTAMAEVPVSTPLSHAISRRLKERGFAFCGPTIVYAFMQATGMVNDHLTGCPRHAEVAAMAGAGGSSSRSRR